ncbi:Hypothetical protein PHPALM_11575 [Phytophthora palmivora]|uniref:Uncharacterized protein n=1 Tax=Phytophthora palmivora TaxID=4796 RepID=A0A2P4Y1X7_9STRA|nr:Hypothetical protein PHPALM_11575 [Phytophthora palmivora]
MGALRVAPMSDEPLFVSDIEAARRVLLAPHRIPLKEFTSLRKKPEDRGGLFPNFTVQESKELREDRLLFYVLEQRDLHIVFVHLIAKQQLHSVMEGIRHEIGARRSDQGGQEELSHAFGYEAPSQPHPSRPSTSGRDSMGSLFPSSSDRVYAIEIALGLGPGGQAAAQAGKPGVLDALHQDMNVLGRETRELHGCVERRVPASALKELRRGLDALSHEAHGRMPSYEPQRYSYHSAYGYGSYARSSHSVPSYPSYASRGYQPVYHSQASTPAAPVVQRTQPRFEEVSSHLGLPPSEKKDPEDRGTA